MNKKVEKVIDQCFNQFKQTQEILDLKEEISMNAMDRYNDALKDGKSEEMACREVLASLGDLDTLLEEINAEEVDNTSFSDTYRKFQKGHLTKENYETIKHIIVRLNKASVNVYDSSDEEVHVYSEDDAFDILVEGNTLTVSEKDNYFSWIHDHELVIKLPDVTKLDIIATTGDIDITNVTIDEVEIHCFAGDICGNNINAHKVNIISIGGDIEWNSYDPLANISLNTTGGDVDLELASLEEGRINLTGGDFDLRIHGEFKTLDIASFGGDITALLEVASVDLNTDVLGGAVKCILPIKEGINKMNISSMGGDIRIQ